MQLYIGCSGFQYDEWKKDFYPEDIPRKRWLEYYSGQFNSVEINSSFYKIPNPENLKLWADQTPDNFRFIFKGYQYITHRKKLNVDDNLVRSLNNFYDALSPLESKIAAILWQFPSNFPYDFERIERFAGHLKKEIPNFFEFRKKEWFKEEVVEFMDDRGLGFCTVSAPELQFHEIFISNNWIYLRMHGKYNWYNYLYREEELKEFQNQIEKADVEEAYIFFNNDMKAQAPENAKQMQELFG